jgi:hypothetical protein
MQELSLNTSLTRRVLSLWIPRMTLEGNLSATGEVTQAETFWTTRGLATQLRLEGRCWKRMILVVVEHKTTASQLRPMQRPQREYQHLLLQRPGRRPACVNGAPQDVHPHSLCRHVVTPFTFCHLKKTGISTTPTHLPRPMVHHLSLIYNNLLHLQIAQQPFQPENTRITQHLIVVSRRCILHKWPCLV